MRIGLDIGSTTIKCAVLDDNGQLVHSSYERHYSHITEKAAQLLEQLAENGIADAQLAISGSAGCESQSQSTERLFMTLM